MERKDNNIVILGLEQNPEVAYNTLKILEQDCEVRDPKILACNFEVPIAYQQVRPLNYSKIARNPLFSFKQFDDKLVELLNGSRNNLYCFSLGCNIGSYLAASIYIQKAIFISPAFEPKPNNGSKNFRESLKRLRTNLLAIRSIKLGRESFAGKGTAINHYLVALAENDPFVDNSITKELIASRLKTTRKKYTIAKEYPTSKHNILEDEASRLVLSRDIKEFNEYYKI